VTRSPRRRRRAGAVALALLALVLPGCARSLPGDEVARACRATVAARWPAWQAPSVDPAVRSWSAQHGEDPTLAHGDFDDDGKPDAAILLRSSAEPGQFKIVVCLSSLVRDKLVVIDDLYCWDGITRMAKGDRYSDMTSFVEGVYPRDGIHAYCFEKAGATYIFSAGAFTPIIDDD